MKTKKLNILILMILTITIYSCASFTKRGFRKEIENLKKINIKKLEGNYSFNPTRRFFNGSKYPEDNIADSLIDTNAYDFLVNERNFGYLKITNPTSLQDYQNKKDYDSLVKKRKKYQISIHLENNKKLKIQVLENLKIIKETVLLGRYRNGMYYLDNEYIDCTGVPFILGGCSNNKRRIGLSKKGNLLINEAVCNESAFLLIIGSGYHFNVTYEYERK